MLVACRLAGLSALLRRTMLTTTPKRNRASKSNRIDAVLDCLRNAQAPQELQRHDPAADGGKRLNL
jgi:hypothetical protein